MLCFGCWKKLFKIVTIQPNLSRLTLKCSRSAGSFKTDSDSYENLILSNTVISTNHLTPELKLRLITPECELWHCKSSESKFPQDPFWGIYWPGGQALGRFILDNPTIFYKKNVLDIGSGSGACALAAAKCGAENVLANDIDVVSIKAILMNSNLNNLQIETSSANLIGEDIDLLPINNNKQSNKPNSKWDVILIGDMFYDTDFSYKLFMWLISLVEKEKTVFVGDPGRHALKDLEQLKIHGTMVKVAEYELTNREHNGFSSSSVYKVHGNCMKSLPPSTSYFYSILLILSQYF